MAQLTNYRSKYRRFPDPSYGFLSWIALEDGYSVTCTDLWNYLGTPDQKADCVLDYLLGWLGEGDAAEYCPTYEDWLLTVISIADQLHHGALQYQRAPEDGDYTIAEVLRATDGRVDLSVPLLDDNLGIDHPALSGSTYEQCRMQYLAKVNRPSQ